MAPWAQHQCFNENLVRCLFGFICWCNIVMFIFWCFISKYVYWYRNIYIYIYIYICVSADRSDFLASQIDSIGYILYIYILLLLICKGLGQNFFCYISVAVSVAIRSSVACCALTHSVRCRVYQEHKPIQFPRLTTFYFIFQNIF